MRRNNKSDNNRAVLDEAAETQRQTRDALYRIQRQAAETEAVGHFTLATLEEQDRKLDGMVEETAKINEKLDKTKRLQDRFAGWSMQFGTNRAARKLARNEKKEVEAMEKEPVTPKKKSKATFGFGKKSKELSTANDDSSSAVNRRVDKTYESNRSELFGSAKHKQEKEPSTPVSHYSTDRTGTPLSDGDQSLLDQIEAEDQSMDPELDIIGQQVDSLLALATSMGEEAEKHNKKLSTVTNDIETSKEKQKVANHRARLFTMNRRQKRQEQLVDRKALTASKMAASVLG